MDRKLIGLLCVTLAWPCWAAAQDGSWSFDPGVLAAGGDLLARTPDPQVDGAVPGRARHGAIRR